MKNIILFILTYLTVCAVHGQEYKIEDVIVLGRERSLMSQKAKQEWAIACWERENSKAEFLPHVSLLMTPLQYNRDVLKRYISETDREEYRTQQSLYSQHGIRLSQKVGFTGGELYVASDLSLMRNMGTTTYTQYSSVPVKLGYSQSLIGFNSYKWDKKIATAEFEEKQREYEYAMHEVDEQTVRLFFNAVLAKFNKENAFEHAKRCDTLYLFGKELFQSGSLSHTDFLNLEIQQLESTDELEERENKYQAAIEELRDYLRMPAISVYSSFELPSSQNLHPLDEESCLSSCRLKNPTYHQVDKEILEASKIVAQNKKQRYLEANMDLSVGFNQYAENFRSTYKKPMQQDAISVGVTISLIDWGIKKRKQRIAETNLRVAENNGVSQIEELERQLRAAVMSHNAQLKGIQTKNRMQELAKNVLNNAFERFKAGNYELKQVLDAINLYQAAKSEYISSLRECWLNFFHIKCIAGI